MSRNVRLGRYELLEKIATGGMAEIYRARALGEAGFERICVVKRVLPHLSTSPTFVQRFLNEARVAAQLHHPSIVQIYDLGKHGDDYFIAMEYIPGESVAEIASKARETGQRVSPSLACHWIVEAAEALAFAHEARGRDGRPLGLVHRDVTPSNLMVTYQGVVKLLDFGIARAAEQELKTDSGQVQGSALYMSPEQAEGRPVDPRSDLWSLGVCLHELLSGGRLFSRGTLGSTLVAVLQAPIPVVGELLPGMPPELDSVVRRALSRDPSQRFSNAAAFASALKSAASPLGPVPSRADAASYLKELFGSELAAAREAALQSGAEAHRPRTAVLPSEAGQTGTIIQLRPPGRPARARALAALGFAGLIAAGAMVLLTRPQPSTEREVSAATPARSDAALPEASTPEVNEALAPPTVTPPAETAEAVEPMKPPRRPQVRPPTTTGFLTLDSEPPAEVRLGDRSLGQTPLRRAPVPAGLQTVKLVNSQFRLSSSLRVRVVAGSEVKRSHQWGKGTLNVNAKPWAEVFVDGVRAGQTPLARHEVWEGRRELLLVGPASQKRLNVTIEPGRSTAVNEILQASEAPGQLVPAARPQ
jgi:eukaryotic-like serine/threonine-protein kinase